VRRADRAAHPSVPRGCTSERGPVLASEPSLKSHEAPLNRGVKRPGCVAIADALRVQPGTHDPEECPYDQPHSLDIVAVRLGDRFENLVPDGGPHLPLCSPHERQELWVLRREGGHLGQLPQCPGLDLVFHETPGKIEHIRGFRRLPCRKTRFKTVRDDCRDGGLLARVVVRKGAPRHLRLRDDVLHCDFAESVLANLLERDVSEPSRDFSPFHVSQAGSHDTSLSRGDGGVAAAVSASAGTAGRIKPSALKVEVRQDTTQPLG